MKTAGEEEAREMKTAGEEEAREIKTAGEEEAREIKTAGEEEPLTKFTVMGLADAFSDLNKRLKNF